MRDAIANLLKPSGVRQRLPPHPVSTRSTGRAFNYVGPSYRARQLSGCKYAALIRHTRVVRPPTRIKDFPCCIGGSTSLVPKLRRRLPPSALCLAQSILHNPQLERRSFMYQNFCSGFLSTRSGDTLGIALCTSGPRTAPAFATASCIKFNPRFHHSANKLEAVGPAEPTGLHRESSTTVHMQIRCLPHIAIPALRAILRPSEPAQTTRR